MSLLFLCGCGAKLQVGSEFAGARAVCPYCGLVTRLPAPAEIVDAELIDHGSGSGSTASPRPSEPQRPPVERPPVAQETDRVAEFIGKRKAEQRPSLAEPSMPVRQFLDPPRRQPAAAAEARPRKPWLQEAWALVLDPRSIQWLLMLGGGLMILGGLIWLISLGVFEQPVVVAALLGTGSLLLLSAGCGMVLRSRYQTAGRALTFLACVVLPLNLWYYQHQGLVSSDGPLWIGALICSVIYFAVVLVLKDPLFLYAVEGGVTLTLLLLLASLGYVRDATYLSMALLGIGMGSLHAERLFSPQASIFRRDRFGLPLFWSGHAQIAGGLLTLLTAQVAHWAGSSLDQWLGIQWADIWLVDSRWIAGGLWIVGAYVYVYSDLVVRRVGVYLYLAAGCLLMAEITLVGLDVTAELLIGVLAGTCLALNLLVRQLDKPAARFGRTLDPLAMTLGGCSLIVALLLHLAATSTALADFGWAQDTGWGFVAAVLAAAVCVRVCAQWSSQPRVAGFYLFLSGAAVMIAAAGLLRVMGVIQWHHQAPLLMLIPIAYMAVSHWWRGHALQEPLQWVAHVAAAVILTHVVLSGLNIVDSVVTTTSGSGLNLLLALTFAEAAAFYALAAALRRKPAAVYLATVASSGAVWQTALYLGIPGDYYTIVYALIGIAMLVAARKLGLQPTDIYRSDGSRQEVATGRGRPWYNSANGLLTVAFLAALLQGLTRLATADFGWTGLLAASLSTSTAIVAVALAPTRQARGLYVAWTIALGAVTFLTLQILVDLSGWQKLELFCVTAGVVVLVASYVGRFRADQPTETVVLGLWAGSLLSAGTLLIAVLAHRTAGDGISLFDELALITMTVLMLASGVSIQLKAPTLVGGGVLGLYLMVLVGSLAYSPQVAIGVYLAAGGGLVFLVGIVLSLYRDRLVSLPETIARREGVFRVINWR